MPLSRTMLLSSAVFSLWPLIARPALASERKTYAVDQTTAGIFVGDVTVESGDDTRLQECQNDGFPCDGSWSIGQGLRLEASVIVPACPGLSRFNGHLTITWTSSSGRTSSHLFRLSNGAFKIERVLSFHERGDFGGPDGQIAVAGGGGCSGG